LGRRGMRPREGELTGGNKPYTLVRQKRASRMGVQKGAKRQTARRRPGSPTHRWPGINREGGGKKTAQKSAHTTIHNVRTMGCVREEKKRRMPETKKKIRHETVACTWLLREGTGGENTPQKKCGTSSVRKFPPRTFLSTKDEKTSPDCAPRKKGWKRWAPRRGSERTPSKGEERGGETGGSRAKSKGNRAA